VNTPAPPDAQASGDDLAIVVEGPGLGGNLQS